MAITLAGLRWRVIPTLWLLTIVCLAALLLDHDFDRRRFFRREHLAMHMNGILLRFAVAATVLGACTWLFTPERLFSFVMQRPVIWALVMCLYPLLSVYPQGIIYRGFIFHRYGVLFGSGRLMILVSGIAFALAHVVLENWVAVALTLPGGLLFAYNYRKSRSLLVAAIEHSLYGCFIFTIGLGWYFYDGSRAFAEQAAGEGAQSHRYVQPDNTPDHHLQYRQAVSRTAESSIESWHS